MELKSAGNHAIILSNASSVAKASRFTVMKSIVEVRKSRTSKIDQNFDNIFNSKMLFGLIVSGLSVSLNTYLVTKGCSSGCIPSCSVCSYGRLHDVHETSPLELENIVDLKIEDSTFVGLGVDGNRNLTLSNVTSTGSINITNFEMFTADSDVMVEYGGLNLVFVTDADVRGTYTGEIAIFMESSSDVVITGNNNGNLGGVGILNCSNVQINGDTQGTSFGVMMYYSSGVEINGDNEGKNAMSIYASSEIEVNGDNNGRGENKTAGVVIYQSSNITINGNNNGSVGVFGFNTLNIRINGNNSGTVGVAFGDSTNIEIIGDNTGDFYVPDFDIGSIDSGGLEDSDDPNETDQDDGTGIVILQSSNVKIEGNNTGFVNAIYIGDVANITISGDAFPIDDFGNGLTFEGEFLNVNLYNLTAGSITILNSSMSSGNFTFICAESLRIEDAEINDLVIDTCFIPEIFFAEVDPFDVTMTNPQGSCPLDASVAIDCDSLCPVPLVNCTSSCPIDCGVSCPAPPLNCTMSCPTNCTSVCPVNCELSCPLSEIECREQYPINCEISCPQFPDDASSESSSDDVRSEFSDEDSAPTELCLPIDQIRRLVEQNNKALSYGMRGCVYPCRPPLHCVKCSRGFTTDRNGEIRC